MTLNYFECLKQVWEHFYEKINYAFMPQSMVVHNFFGDIFLSSEMFFEVLKS